MRQGQNFQTLSIQVIFLFDKRKGDPRIIFKSYVVVSSFLFLKKKHLYIAECYSKIFKGWYENKTKHKIRIGRKNKYIYIYVLFYQHILCPVCMQHAQICSSIQNLYSAKIKTICEEFEETHIPAKAIWTAAGNIIASTTNNEIYSIITAWSRTPFGLQRTSMNKSQQNVEWRLVKGILQCKL